jgi:hypothetical protein
MVYKKLNSAEVLIQRTTKEAPQGKYVLHRLRRSQENNQLWHQRWERTPARARHPRRYAWRAGFVDENSATALDGGDGSDHLHGLDL